MSILRQSVDLCIMASRRTMKSAVFGRCEIEAVTAWKATDPVPTVIVANAILVKSSKSSIWCLNFIYVMPEFRRLSYGTQVLDELVVLHGLENIGACWATPEGAAFASAWQYKRGVNCSWWQVITDAKPLEPPEPPETAGRIPE